MTKTGLLHLLLTSMTLACAPLFCSDEAPAISHEQILKRVPLTYEAVLEPKTRTLITTELNVRVTHIYKRMGDRFHKGDLLMELDREVPEALYNKAIGIADKARITFEAKERLLKDGIASYSEYIDAKANLATAKADLTVATKNLLNTHIVAPYNGRMVNVNVEVDEYPNQELHFKFKPLLEIIDDHVLLAKVLVPAKLLGQLHIGKKLSITINETRQNVEATLSRIGAVLDPISSTILIEASIDNIDGRLLAGMTGIATLEVNLDTPEMP